MIMIILGLIVVTADSCLNVYRDILVVEFHALKLCMGMRHAGI